MNKRICLFLLFLSAFNMNAQIYNIVYTDFEPDTCKYITGLDSNAWFIDINCDGEIDLKFHGYVQCGALLPETFMYNGWQLCYAELDTYLNSDTITWYGYDFWPWNLFKGRYGFRVLIDGHHYYGWMSAWCNMEPEQPCSNYNGYNLDEKNHPVGRNFYIDKIAYCTIPDYPLVYGQTSLDGIDETEAAAFAHIHPNPTSGLVTVSAENLKELEVLNILGQPVLKTGCSGESVTIDLAGQPAGVYFIKITDKDGNKYSEKVVRE
jgi:hypothetical protein